MGVGDGDVEDGLETDEEEGDDDPDGEEDGVDGSGTNPVDPPEEGTTDGMDEEIVDTLEDEALLV